MTPHYADDAVTLYHGDCLDVLRELPDASVDAVVTDPPAGIAFMGKEWDRDKGGRDAWVAWMSDVMCEALRVTKPGGHAFVWALPRTSHWTGTAIENAGWQIRDKVVHLFGSGFPKSHNLDGDWKGWGTALKPAAEDWWLARKPLDGTVAANVLRHGTGALNVDATRIGDADTRRPDNSQPFSKGGVRDDNGRAALNRSPSGSESGRWPANVVLDESQAAELDRQSGVSDPKPQRVGVKGGHTGPLAFGSGGDAVGTWPADPGGGASRFFYVAKAPTAERPRDGEVAHPTVKPLDLMRWLVRLVTPPGGIVLEPFAGSGTTAEACVIEGFRCIAIEREADYLPLIVQRLTKPIQPDLFGGVA